MDRLKAEVSEYKLDAKVNVVKMGANGGKMIILQPL